MVSTDICIAGAGIIGLSLALELHARGLRVTVLEAGQPMQESSTAAAGMLAADDPHNPPELCDLARLSASLYPDFLSRIAALSGTSVPFQTEHTLHFSREASAESHRSALLDDLLFGRSPQEHTLPPGTHLLDERSIDPRQLATALLKAIAATPIRLSCQSPVLSTKNAAGSIQTVTPKETIEAAHFVDCTGAWANDPAYHVVPIKGQMLALGLPESLPLAITLRNESIYIVPRTTGPNAGRAIVGATVEDAGFDKSVHPAQIQKLQQAAAALLPQLAQATPLESWSGLRPATSDRLPILGPHPARSLHWIATGHYRNGILLAPGTAHIMARLLVGDSPLLSLANFDPRRSSLRM